MKLRLITNKCNACGETMIPDKYDFYICTGCGVQLCPPSDTKKEVKKQILDAMAHNHLVSDPQMQVKSHSCGSRRSKSSSSAKGKMQKPTGKQLYNILSDQPNKIKLKKA